MVSEKKLRDFLKILKILETFAPQKFAALRYIVFHIQIHSCIRKVVTYIHVYIN